MEDDLYLEGDRHPGSRSLPLCAGDLRRRPMFMKHPRDWHPNTQFIAGLIVALVVVLPLAIIWFNVMHKYLIVPLQAWSGAGS